MSVSNILGNTDNETDARKVPWVNIVCNSIYAINSKTKNVVAEEGTIQDLNSDDATIQDLTVSNINSYPPTIIGVQKYTTNVAPHTHNVGDQVYTIPLNTLEFSQGVIGSAYSGTPGTINILITGVYLINFQFQMTYIGVPRSSTITYTTRVRIGPSTSRFLTTLALWAGSPGYTQGSTILNLSAGETVRLQVPSISVGQGGPLELAFTTQSEFSVVKLL